MISWCFPRFSLVFLRFSQLSPGFPQVVPGLSRSIRCRRSLPAHVAGRGAGGAAFLGPSGAAAPGGAGGGGEGGPGYGGEGPGKGRIPGGSWEDGDLLVGKPWENGDLTWFYQFNHYKWWFNDDFLWFNLGWTMVNSGMIWDTITMYNR